MSRAPILTTKIGAATWSFGYSWQSATSLETLKRDAEAEGSLPGVQADVVALRQDSTHPQFGLGYLADDDRKKGMAAASAFATELASHNIRAAIGLFPVADAYWLIIIDEDLIPIYGDRVYGSLDEGLAGLQAQLFGKQRKSRQWPRLYIPSAVLQAAQSGLANSERDGTEPSDFDAYLKDNIARLSTSSLADILCDAKLPAHRQRRVRRYDVKAILGAKPALAAYAMIAVAGIFTFVVLPLYHRLGTQLQGTDAALATASGTPAPPVLNSPVPSSLLPSAGDLLTACFRQLAQLDDRLPWGWEDEKLSCNTLATSASLHRATGTLAGLESAYPLAGFSYDTNYDIATVTLALARPLARARQTLEQPETLRRRLYGLSWATSEPITVDGFAQPPARAPDDKAIWRQANFTITSDADPAHWGPVLDAIPGLAVTTVSLNVRQMKTSPLATTWEIKGIAYAK